MVGLTFLVRAVGSSRQDLSSLQSFEGVLSPPLMNPSEDLTPPTHLELVCSGSVTERGGRETLTGSEARTFGTVSVCGESRDGWWPGSYLVSSSSL